MRYRAIVATAALLVLAACGLSSLAAGAPAPAPGAKAPSPPAAPAAHAPAVPKAAPAAPTAPAAPAPAPAAPSPAPSAPAPAAPPAAPPAGAPSAAAGTKPYQYTDGMKVDLAILRAHGMLRTAAKDDFGAKADIAVSDGLAVTGVPVDFLAAAVRSEQAYVVGVLQANEAPATGPKGRLDAARSIVRLWLRPLLTKYAEAAGVAAGKAPPKPVLADLIRFDIERQRARDSREGKPPAFLAADWLLFVKRLELQREPPYAPKWQQPEASLRELLERFEPDTPVTAANADAVAEELVWTKALGLSDAAPKTLATARFVLQALILEAVDGEIGDPGDPDFAKAAAAIKKLEQVKAAFRKQWDAAAKQAPPAAKPPAPAAPAAAPVAAPAAKPPAAKPPAPAASAPAAPAAKK